MPYLVVSSHVKADSATVKLARRVVQALQSLGEPVELLDLASQQMPWCDGHQCYEQADTQALAEKVRGATAIILCTPIYNYTVNAALKNFIELTGRAWQDKVVGFAVSAGGPASYMAIMQAANWLMLDHRCVIVPRFVYATREAFTDRELSDEDVIRRLDELAKAVVRMGKALS